MMPATMEKNMTSKTTVFSVLVSAALFGLSCASSPPPPAPESPAASPAPAAAASPAAPPVAAPAPPPAPAAPAAPPAPPPKLANLPGMTVTWNDLDATQRKEYMKKAIMPRMGDEFAAFDAKFNEFTCKTCHGSGAKAGTFKMPNQDLPKLPFTNPDAMKKVAMEKPAMVMFMNDMVKNHMADLLGKKPFDPKTKTGQFGCTACHMAL